MSKTPIGAFIWWKEWYGICVNAHHQIKLSNILLCLPIRWPNERQIWIGFKKNKENNDCLIDELAKAVVFHILSFLR